MNLTLIGLVMTIGFTSCEKDLIEYRQGDIKVCVEQGRDWLHDFPVFLGITKKNPPQIAIWLDDMQLSLDSLCFAQDSDTRLANGKRQPQKRSIAALVSFSWNSVCRWTLSADKG